MRALLLLLTLVAAGPALAQAPTSIETELVKGRCRFIADDGEVGHYALKRCPGLNGIRVYTTAGVQQVSLAFGFGQGEAAGGRGEFAASASKLEWRGTGTKAAFKPYATIVQRGREGPRGGREEYNVLAVIRMEARRACLMAVLDEAGNPNALALARATADAEAPTFSCADGQAEDRRRAELLGAGRDRLRGAAAVGWCRRARIPSRHHHAGRASGSAHSRVSSARCACCREHCGAAGRRRNRPTTDGYECTTSRVRSNSTTCWNWSSTTCFRRRPPAPRREGLSGRYARSWELRVERANP